MPIRLAIVTPTQELLDLECDEVVAPGSEGELGLLPGHVPLITALRPGVLTVIQGGRKQYYAVSTGFAEVEENVVTVLTESCEEAATIDVDRAKRALADAESKLASAPGDDPNYLEQKNRAARASARLNAAERR